MVGLFSGLFGKKQEKNTIETTLELLPTIMQKTFETKRKDLEIVSAKKMSELKYLHEKCMTLLNDIEKKEIGEKDNARFNKAALTAKTQLENQLLKLLEKINPGKIDNSIEEMRKYSGESFALLFNDINTYRKSIAYTSAYLKDEMKMLGETIQELLNKLKELNDIFNENKEIFSFEKAKEEIVEITMKEKRIFELNKEIVNINKQIEAIENNVKNKNKIMQDFQEGEKMLVVKQLEEEKSSLLNKKQELRVEVSQMLTTIDRPLQRFKALVDSGRWKIANEEKNLLELFVNNPMNALKVDLGAKGFKSILKEVISAIEDGKIDLKDREKEKRLDALNEFINFDFFEKVFWKLNEIQKRTIEIENTLNKNNTKIELGEKEKEIDYLLDDKKKLVVEIENRQKEINQIKNENSEKSKRVLDFASRVVGKEIVLK